MQELWNNLQVLRNTFRSVLIRVLIVGENCKQKFLRSFSISSLLSPFAPFLFNWDLQIKSQWTAWSFHSHIETDHPDWLTYLSSLWLACLACDWLACNWPVCREPVCKGPVVCRGNVWQGPVYRGRFHLKFW